MAHYTPPLGDAVNLSIKSGYSIPNGDTIYINLETEEVCGFYDPLSPLATTLHILSGYIIPPGDMVNLSLGLICDPTIPPIPEPPFFERSFDLLRSVGISWGTFLKSDPETSIPWQPRDTLDIETQIPWGKLDGTDNDSSISWKSTTPLDNEIIIPWGGSLAINNQFGIPWVDLNPLDANVKIPWGDLTDFPQQEYTIVWALPPANDVEKLIPWDEAEPVDTDFIITWGQAIPCDIEVKLPFNHGVLPTVCIQEYRPFPGCEIPLHLSSGYIIPPGDAIILSINNDNDVIYCVPRHTSGRADVYLNPPVIFPNVHQVLSTYTIMNMLDVVKLPAMTPISVKNLSFTFDRDSFAWQFRGELSEESDLTLVLPTPGGTEIMVTVNGHPPWIFIVESYTKTRSFNNTTINFTGRSKSARLAAPFADKKSRLETTARTSIQLADDEISPLGWSLVWLMPSYIVPANTYSYTDLSPIESVIKIASATGGIVYPDKSLNVLTVAPSYPVDVWDWAVTVPVTSVPSSFVSTIGERIEDRAPFNAVYISGSTSNGVLVNVERTGSSGNFFATMRTDALITHQDAGREAGRNILNKGGGKGFITISLPLLASPGVPGLLQVLDLIEIVDTTETWTGMILSVTINCSWSSGLIVEQIIEVERQTTQII